MPDIIRAIRRLIKVCERQTTVGNSEGQRVGRVDSLAERKDRKGKVAPRAGLKRLFCTAGYQHASLSTSAAAASPRSVAKPIA